MAKIFVTGSADGLGELTARALIRQGHKVVLHARNSQRGRDAIKKNPQAVAVLTGDLSNVNETINLADKANKQGPFDAVIHNAGVYRVSGKEIFAVNTLAPYILTCLIQKPKRLIYLSSGLHSHGQLRPEHFKTDIAATSYADSKFHVMLLCMAVARNWADVYANAVDPGWVPTRMGGRNAPDNLQQGYETQVWLAVSNEANAKVTGRYFFHQKQKHHNAEADSAPLQQKLLNLCKELTGISFPI
jgi:NAD(P)-dependent dehydrogenase (short-subunit alcohol dehydrogenase family)